MYILLLDIQTVYDYFTSLFLKMFLIVVTIDSKQYTEYISAERLAQRIKNNSLLMTQWLNH